MNMEPLGSRRLSLPLHHHHCQQSHHHHHCHHVILCTRHQHQHHHHHHHMNPCPNHHYHHFLLNPGLSQNPEARGALPADNQFQLEPSAFVNEAHPFGTLLLDADDGVEEAAEEEEDPIFVLTDEWREFFAKSEAKRRLAKKKAKKDRK